MMVLNTSNYRVDQRSFFFAASSLFVILLPGCVGPAGGVDVWQAVRDEDVVGLAKYVTAGGDLNIRDWGGMTPLFFAFSEKKRESYKKLLELGADPNLILSEGRVVTNYAAADRDSYWVRLALQHGGDANLLNEGAAPSRRGTPLTFAVGRGSIENVKLLVEHGADVDAVTDGQPILLKALYCNRFDIVLYFLEQGAKFDVSNDSPETSIGFMKRFDPNLYLKEEERRQFEAVRTWLRKNGVTFDN